MLRIGSILVLLACMTTVSAAGPAALVAGGPNQHGGSVCLAQRHLALTGTAEDLGSWEFALTVIEQYPIFGCPATQTLTFAGAYDPAVGGCLAEVPPSPTWPLHMCLGRAFVGVDVIRVRVCAAGTLCGPGNTLLGGELPVVLGAIPPA